MCFRSLTKIQTQKPSNLQTVSRQHCDQQKKRSCALLELYIHLEKRMRGPIKNIFIQCTGKPIIFPLEILQLVKNSELFFFHLCAVFLSPECLKCRTIVLQSGFNRWGMIDFNYIQFCGLGLTFSVAHGSLGFCLELSNLKDFRIWLISFESRPN